MSPSHYILLYPSLEKSLDNSNQKWIHSVLIIEKDNNVKLQVNFPYLQNPPQTHIISKYNSQNSLRYES